MCIHQAQNRFIIVNPRVLAILRAKCTQKKNDIFFWILQDLSFPTHFRLFKLDKNSLVYDILKFDEIFFFDPYSTENFRKGGHFLDSRTKFK